MGEEPASINSSVVTTSCRQGLMRRDAVAELGSLIVIGMVRANNNNKNNGGQVVVLNQMKPGESNYCNELRSKIGS